MDWENHLEKNSIQKIEKTVKIRVKLPHVNKKSLPRNREKNSRRKTTRFFASFPVSAWPKSLLQFDFKSHENVWTDLKKKTAPQYNSNSLICKNSLNCKKQNKSQRKQICAANRGYVSGSA